MVVASNPIVVTVTAVQPGQFTVTFYTVSGGPNGTGQFYSSSGPYTTLAAAEAYAVNYEAIAISTGNLTHGTYKITDSTGTVVNQSTW